MISDQLHPQRCATCKYYRKKECPVVVWEEEHTGVWIADEDIIDVVGCASHNDFNNDEKLTENQKLSKTIRKGVSEIRSELKTEKKIRNVIAELSRLRDVYHEDHIARKGDAVATPQQYISEGRYEGFKSAIELLQKEGNDKITLE
jgi:hypothetical protein